MIINYLISVYLFLYRPFYIDFYTNSVASHCIYKTLKQNKPQQCNILCEILLQFECLFIQNID